ncbi:proline and serine-rich protein 3 isoform X1 [Entelurus aequoreus]|uniref:proline and serine-rich protein 3 isoform X1 n=2 Tax=Entelurus aequoreus TaxID=161455 RepID=UPI002B1D715A|nr:proline and serine-rich protein 3 isoform X1 [Entelurus aequoreus]
MKSRNSVMTRLKTPQPASPPTGKAPFGQPPHKALPDKRNKASLIPVFSNQKDNPKVHRPEKHGDQWTTEKRQPSLAQSGISMDKDSSSTLSDTDIILMLSSRAQEATVSSRLGQQQHSRVDTYIDRFRYGHPMSREERQQMSSVIEGDTTPFWRLSSSSLPPSSTPTKTSHIDDHRRELFGSVTRQFDEDLNSSTCRGDYNMDAYVLSDSCQSEFEVAELLHFQEKTRRLLQRGENVLSEGLMPASSDGLGRHEPSYPVNIAEPVYRPLINTTITSTAAMPLQRFTATKSIAPPTHPEEDILFQWRLRRKMEQASKLCQSQQTSGLLLSSFHSTLPVSSGNEQPYKQQQIVQCTEPTQGAVPQPETKETHGHQPSAAFSVSDSSVPRPESLARVPAHMHQLCDLFPCPSLSPSSNLQGSSHKQKETSSKETQVSGNFKDAYMEELAHRHVASPPPASCITTEVGWTCRPTNGGHIFIPVEVGSHSCSVKGGFPLSPLDKSSPARPLESVTSYKCIKGGCHSRPRERDCIGTKVATKDKAQKKQLGESQTDGAIRKQKKSARRNERSENTDSPNITSKSSAHQKPPLKNKSRIEQQQQQEIRKKEDNHTPPFSPVQQSLEQVVSEVLFPPTESSPAKVAAVPLLPTPSQSSHPPCDTHNSLEVMSQLLQEAEDSDEIEFADDPLLQVLRTQRKWVKEQISEVNSMAYKFLITQEVSPT